MDSVDFWFEDYQIGQLLCIRCGPGLLTERVPPCGWSVRKFSAVANKCRCAKAAVRIKISFGIGQGHLKVICYAIPAAAKFIFSIGFFYCGTVLNCGRIPATSLRVIVVTCDWLMKLLRRLYCHLSIAAMNPVPPLWSIWVVILTENGES